MEQLNKIIDQIDQQRQQTGFLTVSEVLALTDQGNRILDPFSVLISQNCQIGQNNLFYPNVTLEADPASHIQVGDENIFYNNTHFRASHQGNIQIGNYNQLGAQGLMLQANKINTRIQIGNQGRYQGGAQILGTCHLGNGTQILGAVTVENCHLQAGESFQHDQADERGAVIKGQGRVRGLDVPKGSVILCAGMDHYQLIAQSHFHPGPEMPSKCGN